MIDILKDLTQYGRVVPMFDAIFGAAVSGRHYITLAPQSSEVMALKAHYEQCGFLCTIPLVSAEDVSLGLTSLRVQWAEAQA